jgi:hypothetical protein
MLVVADASPLILLGKLGLLDLLPDLYDQVVVPRVVLDEVTSGEEELPGSRAVRDARWLDVVESDAAAPGALEATLRNELDRGEAAAIALAESLDADLLLIDERQGRRAARRLGLEIKGTLGALVQGRRRGLGTCCSIASCPCPASRRGRMDQ